MPLQAQVGDLLYGKTGYVKKLIEDCNNSEDTCKLLRVRYFFKKGFYNIMLICYNFDCTKTSWIIYLSFGSLRAFRCMYLILTCFVLQFCSWENPHFSSTVLSELLWQVSKSGVILKIVFCEVYKSRYRMWLIITLFQVAYSYTYELRPYLDLLLQMLLLEDSWQNHRIHNALKGMLTTEGVVKCQIPTLTTYIEPWTLNWICTCTCMCIVNWFY